jgi:hypothetical protein
MCRYSLKLVKIHKHPDNSICLCFILFQGLSNGIAESFMHDSQRQSFLSTLERQTTLDTSKRHDSIMDEHFRRVQNIHTELLEE